MTDKTGPSEMPEANKADAMPEGANPLALDLQLCFQLYSAANRMVRLYRPLLDELGLTYPQYLTMLVLWETDGRLVGEIGQALGLDSGTLTPLLKRLEGSGLVTRVRDAEDERKVRVALTEVGCALRARAEAVPGQVACQLPLDRAALVGLHATLRAFNAGVGV